VSALVTIAYQASLGRHESEATKRALFAALAWHIEFLERQLLPRAQQPVPVTHFTLPGARCIWCREVPVPRGHGRQCASRGRAVW